MTTVMILCELCSELILDGPDFELHMQISHGDKMSSSDYCDQESNNSFSNEDLKLKEIAVVKDDVYSSNRRYTTEFRRSGREKRGRPRKNSFDVGPKVYVCDFCDYTATGGYGLGRMKKHRLTHSVKCPFCRFETIHNDQLDGHIQKNHSTEPQPIDEMSESREDHTELIVFPTMNNNNNKTAEVQEKTAPNFVIGRCINDTIIDENEDEENFAYLNIDMNGVIVKKEDARLFSEATRFMDDLPQIFHKSEETNPWTNAMDM